MERRNNYPIEIKAKVDLNTELILSEFATLVGKNKSQIIRLIITDFIDRNIDILDQKLKQSTNKEIILHTLFRDLIGLNKKEIKNYKEYEKSTQK